MTLFPRLLDWLAGLVGVETPVNLLFLLAIVMLIGVALHLTQAISRLTEDTRILAEEIAIKDFEVRQLQERIAVLERRTRE